MPARPSSTPVARPSLRVVASVDLTQNGSANVVFDERQQRVYLLSYEGVLTAVDAKTNAVTSSLMVSSSGSVFAEGLAIDSTSGHAFVYFVNESSSFGGSLAVVDTATNSVVATIAPKVVGDFGIGGVAINPITGCVYVGNFASAVAVVDATSNTELGTIDLTGQVFDVAVDTIANRVFVLSGSSTAVVDGSRNVVVDHFDVGGEAIGVNPRTGRAYVASPGGDPYGNGILTVIDGFTGTISKRLTMMNRPSGIAVDPVANRIYVANVGSGTVSVIDGASDEVVAIATVAHAMGYGIAADPRTGRIYIVETYGLPNTLQVLE